MLLTMRTSMLKFDRISRRNLSQLTIPRARQGSEGDEADRDEQYDPDEAGKATEP